MIQLLYELLFISILGGSVIGGFHFNLPWMYSLPYFIFTVAIYFVTSTTFDFLIASMIFGAAALFVQIQLCHIAKQLLPRK